MSKLICMQGLPSSGKSTKAKEILKQYGNAVRINRDLLRTCLHFDSPWNGRQEDITKTAARTLAFCLLNMGKVNVVVIDDCNLHPGTVESWKQLTLEIDARFEIIRMDTPMEECLRRDRLREKRVGDHVIVSMAMQFSLYTPQKGYVVCDLDGTVSDCEWRRHYIRGEKKDWKSFFDHMGEDPVRDDVSKQVIRLREEGYDIVFVSARPDDYREQTERWLAAHGFLPYRVLLMRRAHDSRTDVDVKRDILRTYFPNTALVHLVIDDRPSILKMWNEEGLQTLDVGDGKEF